MRVIVVAIVVLLTACNKEVEHRSFVESLHCGMSRMEVRRAASAEGYGDSDRSWLERTIRTRSRATKQLTLVDLTFHGDSLVAVRTGIYDPKTKRVSYRTVNLCEEPAKR